MSYASGSDLLVCRRFCVMVLLPLLITQDVDSTFFERYGRQMDVKTTLCAHRPHSNIEEIKRNTDL